MNTRLTLTLILLLGAVSCTAHRANVANQPASTCTRKESLVQAWCVNNGCTKTCNLYEDGKLLGPSSGPEQPYNRIEGKNYACKCE
jgi:hypothetical protein